MTVSILVENRFGVLTQITSFFSARGYNIASMKAERCEDDPGLTRISVVLEGAGAGSQLVKQLHNLTEVVEARFEKAEPEISRS